MSGYTHEYTQFPESNSVTTLTPTFKNIDSTVGNVVASLQKAKAESDFGTVAKIIEQNSNLVDYIIDAEIINTLVEDLRNTQIYAKQVQQNIYIGDKPEVVQFGDIRIGQPT